jgi:hypothetical protein
MPAINITGGGGAAPPTTGAGATIGGIGNAAAAAVAAGAPAGAGPTTGVFSKEFQREMDMFQSLQRIKDRSFANERREMQENFRLEQTIMRARQREMKEREKAEAREAKQREKDLKEQQRLERTAAREHEREERARDRQDQQRRRQEERDTNFRIRSVNNVARMRHQYEQREQRTEERNRRERRANMLRSAGVAGLAVNALHGDVEGAGALAGGGLGLVLGGPAGAAIGAELGELVAKVIKGVVTLPMAPGNLWGQYLGVSKPWMDLKTSGYEMARAGGFGGGGLVRGLMPGNYAAPPWMRALGMTPEAGMESLSRFGIVPRSRDEALGMIQNARVGSLTRGYSGMAPGTVENVMGQGISLGMTTPGGAGVYSQQFAGMLEVAIARGMDRTKLLNRMQDSIDMLAKTSAGVNAGAMNDTFMRFMMSGAPGGRTGEMAASAVAGTQDMLENMQNNAVAYQLYFTQAKQNNNFRTPSDVKNFIGEENWNKMDPAYRDRLVQMVNQAGSMGNLAAQMPFMAALRGGDTGRVQAQNAASIAAMAPGLPEVYQTLLTGAANQYRAPVEVARRVGGERMAAEQYQPRMGMEAAMVRQMSGLSDADTENRLRAMGVPEGLIPVFMRVQREQGVPAMMLAGVAKHESGFDMTKVNTRNRNGSVDYGLMQVNTIHQPEMTAAEWRSVTSDAYANVTEGAKVLKMGGGLGGYNPGDPNYAGNVLREMQPFISNLTEMQDVYGRTALASQAVDTGSMYMFNNLGGIMEHVSATATGAADAVRAFANSLDNISNFKLKPASGGTNPATGRATSRGTSAPHPVRDRVVQPQTAQQ